MSFIKKEPREMLTSKGAKTASKLKFFNPVVPIS